MELLDKYHTEGDCLSKAMAEMLLKSINKNITDLRVSPSLPTMRGFKDFSNIMDRSNLKDTAAETSVRNTQGDNSMNAAKSVFERQAEVEVKPWALPAQ